MLLGGLGNGPGAHTGPYWLGEGASLAGGVSGPRVSRPTLSVRDVPFVSFCKQKEND